MVVFFYRQQTYIRNLMDSLIPRKDLFYSSHQIQVRLYKFVSEIWDIDGFNKEQKQEDCVGDFDCRNIWAIITRITLSLNIDQLINRMGICETKPKQPNKSNFGQKHPKTGASNSTKVKQNKIGNYDHHNNSYKKPKTIRPNVDLENILKERSNNDSQISDIEQDQDREQRSSIQRSTQQKLLTSSNSHSQVIQKTQKTKRDRRSITEKVVGSNYCAVNQNNRNQKRGVAIKN